MQTSDFILIGDSLLSNLTDKLSNLFSVWSEDWFNHEVSFQLCRFEEVDSWQQYSRVTLSQNNIYVFSPNSIDVKNIFFQGSIDKANNIDKISDYFLAEAFDNLSTLMMGALALENSTDFSIWHINDRSGFIVIDVMIGINNFRVLFKEIRPNKAVSVSPSADIMSIVLNRRTSAVVVFNKSDISISDLYSMKSGDVIKLNHLISEPLRLCRNEQDIGQCHIGTIDDHLAIKIMG